MPGAHLCDGSSVTELILHAPGLFGCLLLLQMGLRYQKKPEDALA